MPVDVPPGRSGLADLFLIASDQAGYFTTAQAEAEGWTPQRLSYHTRVGNIRRVYTGVYRFRDYPPTQHEDVVAAWLALGKDSAVVSHESALDIWDLADLIPDAIHLTVPRRRRNLPKLPGVRFHTPTSRFQVRDDEIQATESSLRVTSPQRTLLDIAVAGISSEHVIVGVRQALARGWIDVARLRGEARRRSKRVAAIFERALLQTVGSAASHQM